MVLDGCSAMRIADCATRNIQHPGKMEISSSGSCKGSSWQLNGRRQIRRGIAERFTNRSPAAGSTLVSGPSATSSEYFTTESAREVRVRTLKESRRMGRKDERGEETVRKKEDRENRERRERRLPEKRQQHRAGGSCARKANNLVSNHLTRVTRRSAGRVTLLDASASSSTRARYGEYFGIGEVFGCSYRYGLWL